MKYTSQNKYRQLTLDLFRSSLDNLDKSNRWVILGDTLPWAELEMVYNSRLNNKDRGADNKPARMVISAMLIKHKMNLSDEETILIIQENPYMQYMCGLPELTDKPIFHPSLFVTIRERITEKEINEMTVRLLEEQRRRKAEATRMKMVIPALRRKSARTRKKIVIPFLRMTMEPLRQSVRKIA